MNFVGWQEVLSLLEVAGGTQNHVAIAQSIGVSRFKVSAVLQRAVKMGWVECLKRAGRGRLATPGIYRLTVAGRRKLAGK